MRTHPHARVLDEAALESISGRVTVPSYDRRRLRPSIVHIGVGGFHRAHQAVYLDDLAGIGGDWGERGIGLQPRDRRTAEALVPQQGLYTLVARGPERDRARVVGSILDYLFAPDQPDAVLGTLTDPATRIVTMTVTEGGYNVDESTGQFDETSEAARADLRNPGSPTTWFGYLCKALHRRWAAGIPPFTVLSCDNIQSNGEVARTALVSFARLCDDVLAGWIERHVAFPSCMVDRITPQTTDADRALVAEEFGIADRWPVVTEPFRQWVVEDVFCNGRPALEEAGVQMVGDVLPYETMKLRLLNASHSAMAYLGYLAGHRTVDAAMRDPLFRTFVERQMRKEVAPLLPPVPGVDLDAYQRTLIERFSNPKIADRLSRLCQDGSAKVPKFLLPPLRDAVDAGRPHRLLTLALAGWLRYLTGVDEAGRPIDVHDARAAELTALAVSGRDDPRPVLSARSVFGDLIERDAFVTELHGAWRDLHRDGVRAVLSRSLEMP